MGADSRTARHPEGEKLRSVAGVKQTRSVRGAATEAQPAEGVETLGAGPGGTWHPRPTRASLTSCAEEPSNVQEGGYESTRPCWREPEGGLERRSGEPGGESPEERGEVCERKQRPITGPLRGERVESREAVERQAGGA